MKEFLDAIQQSFKSDNFVKITLSKSSKPTEDLKNVYIRQIQLKNKETLSFTYRNKTNDLVKNYSIDDGLKMLEVLLTNNFKIGTLFTLEYDISLKINKKGKIALLKVKPSFTNKLPETHDRPKEKRVENYSYLFHLGITNDDGSVIPKMADKFRQINKYLEIIEVQLSSIELPDTINIVDMGSGKGYLTFALYDFLTNKLNLKVNIIGIELRKELVDFCNSIADKCEFENLTFISERIENYNIPKIDVIIALHACDTATDDAIFKGITSNAQLIITAPCCHKQIRQQVKGKQQESPLLKYGIFKERQFEMVTDTLRALLLEKQQYHSSIFEFISNEHTRKNIILIGSKLKNQNQNITQIDEKIEQLKKDFQIQYHYLEKLLA